MKQASEAGFTLMEVLVALTVLSTAAVGFITMTQDSVAGSKQVEARYLARIVADNQLAGAMTAREPLTRGIESGIEEQMRREFLWTRTVLDGPQAGVLLVQVDVRAGDADLVLAQATTLTREQ